jgi:hypothetical protein
VSRRLTTQDCGICDCTRAAYRQDLCRVHYAMLPTRENMERMIATMSRAHAEAKANRAAVVESLQTRLDQVAS